MRVMITTFQVYKFWELEKEFIFKAAMELVKIFPILPGEEFFAKWDREWELREYIRHGKMELLNAEQRHYYETAEFFADGEIYVEGMTWGSKKVCTKQVSHVKDPVTHQSIQPVQPVTAVRILPKEVEVPAKKPFRGFFSN